MQPSLLDIPEPRVKKRGRVTRTSVKAYLEKPRSHRVNVAVTWLSRATEPVTSAELAAQAYLPSGVWAHPSLDTVMETRRALSDALALGLVEHAGTRRCAVSGRTCVTWQTRGR